MTASYGLFQQLAPFGTVTAGTGNNGTNGLHVTVAATSTLNGVWHYSAAADTQLPTSVGVYSITTLGTSGTLLTSNTATWLNKPGGSSAAAGSGWCYAALTTPQTLSPGTDYMATCFRNDAVNRWFSFYSQPWPFTNGTLTAPKDESTSALSQGWYNIGTTMAFPTTQSGTAGSNFGMDVNITTSATTPAMIQAVSTTSISTPVSLTFPLSTTAGNCIIIGDTSSASPTNATISAVTLGGAAGNFASVMSVGNPSSDTETTEIWADPNCAGGQTALSITVANSGGSFNVVATEWYGILTSSITDKTASTINNTGSTSWSSGATATTTQASEVAIGVTGNFNATAVGTITGPVSPWNNLMQVTSATTHVGILFGFQVLTSTGTITYSGTDSATVDFTTVVATFKAGVVSTSAIVNQSMIIQAVKRASSY